MRYFMLSCIYVILKSHLSLDKLHVKSSVGTCGQRVPHESMWL